jgi:hypothetical protein
VYLGDSVGDGATVAAWLPSPSWTGSARCDGIYFHFSAGPDKDVLESTFRLTFLLICFSRFFSCGVRSPGFPSIFVEIIFSLIFSLPEKINSYQVWHAAPFFSFYNTRY